MVRPLRCGRVAALLAAAALLLPTALLATWASAAASVSAVAAYQDTPMGSWPGIYAVVAAGAFEGETLRQPDRDHFVQPSNGSGQDAGLAVIGTFHAGSWTETISGGGYVSHGRGTVTASPGGPGDLAGHLA